MQPDEPEDVEHRIDQLFQRFEELYDRCLYQSAARVSAEVRRLAKAEGRLIPYMRACFHVMNSAPDLLEPDVGRETAVELLALLESEDQARRLQPDFPEEEYQRTVWWMSACAYDNLARSTAIARGYNSDGTHGCIAEGIEVCRRTGKLRCITCFREYATEVFRAADDLDMALHHARQVANHPDPRPGQDRRWVGVNDEANLLLLQGKLAAAEETALRALPLTASYHNTLSSRLHTLCALETNLLLSGAHERFASIIDGPPPAAPPQGEFPYHEFRIAQRDALAACCTGDHARAISLLSHWDRWLHKHGCLDPWFEARLRLIAAHRLAGQDDRVQALAKQLDERARSARDWMTLRRLARLLDPAEPPVPTAPLAAPDRGPFARTQSTAAPAAPPAEATPPLPDEAQQTSPLQEKLTELQQRLEQAAADENADPAPFLAEILSHAPGSVTHPRDAAHLLHLAFRVVSGTAQPAEVWAWAERLTAPFPQNAAVLSHLAWLGFALNGQVEEGQPEVVPEEQVEALFRGSLELDPDHVGSHARAAMYFLAVNNLGEAERCLARGSRLARGDSFFALQLAQVYKQTERPRDALVVLDMCLREGCDDPGVAWDAAVTALGLEQHEALLTYLDRFEALNPGQPWACYYRALGLLDLGRPAEALQAVDEEARRSPDPALHLDVLRAAAAAALGHLDEFRSHLGRALEVRLATVDTLTHSGLVRLFQRLWLAARVLPEDDPQRQDLEIRLLATGLAPEEFFDAKRQQGEPVPDVNFYRCLVRQPLDDRWAGSYACLNGEEGWQSYRIVWGVLARDEDEAARLVLEWHRRCYPLPAEVEEVQCEQEGFTDKPGVVWQGFRTDEQETE